MADSHLSKPKSLLEYYDSSNKIDVYNSATQRDKMGEIICQQVTW